MHAILLPKIDKVLIYDATIWKISKIPLPPHKMPCRIADHTTGKLDGWCHSVLFDIETSKLKALKLQTDTWCSSGGLTVDGNLVSAGGNGGGANAVRYLSTCPTCDWREYSTALADPRWYSTQVTLADGGFIVVGGRGAFSYDIPPEGQSNKQAIFLPLIQNTHDQLRGIDGQIFFTLENNLYPFVHLSPDGNLFIFSNNRSILLAPASNKVVREFPDLPGGSRNYPASGMSALLPIKLHSGNAKARLRNISYLDCKTAEQSKLQSRIPTRDLLMLNGAKTGTSAWNDAEDPNFVPVLYRPNADEHERFKELAATTTPRMYHSSAILLPDGKVLVAGSNTNDGYEFDVKYPTELKVEKFSPSYINPSLAQLRQHIIVESSDQLINYGKRLSVRVRSKEMRLNRDEVEVTMYAPAFTTHGISMNQRLIILNLIDVINNIWPRVHGIIAETPSSGAVAPPGYYLLYVVYKGVPSVAMWI
ncbi:glyoxal oxidase-related protein [Melia azedarach]|uniref:Glyoxal oxidase-related protein n=1 Tax=Melia azedarach TaxID=155640 RepID=A0ACC1Y7D8_MELAZ|nr:glyoxal oxidase-related protein [Melia azedarach]